MSPISYIIITILGVVVVGALVYMIRSQVRELLEPTWEDRIKNAKIEDKKGMSKLLLASVTYGMCEIGELFGNLINVKKALPPAKFGDVEANHVAFQDAIRLMWEMSHKFEEVEKKKPGKAVEVFERQRTIALYHLGLLKEIKYENGLEWNDPIIVGPMMV